MLSSIKTYFVGVEWIPAAFSNKSSWYSIGWSVALHVFILNLMFFGSQYQPLTQMKTKLPRGNTLEIVMDSVVSSSASPKRILAPKPSPKIINDKKIVNHTSVKKQASLQAIPDPNSVKVSEKPASSKPASSTAESASSGAPVYGVADGLEVNARDRYIAELKAFIESKKQYPASARMLRQSGKVVVSFTLSSSGQIGDVSVVQGCSFEKLNQSAKNLLESLGSFKKFPDELKMNQLKLVVPIEYTLS